jgi:hypothetical protein
MKIATVEVQKAFAYVCDVKKASLRVVMRKATDGDSETEHIKKSLL